jgi:hypothetical protein
MPENILGGRNNPCGRAFSVALVGENATPLPGTNAGRITWEGVSNAAEQSQPQHPLECDLPVLSVSAAPSSCACAAWCVAWPRESEACMWPACVWCSACDACAAAARSSWQGRGPCAEAEKTPKAWAATSAHSTRTAAFPATPQALSISFSLIPATASTSDLLGQRYRTKRRRCGIADIDCVRSIQRPYFKGGFPFICQAVASRARNSLYREVRNARLLDRRADGSADTNFRTGFNSSAVWGPASPTLIRAVRKHIDPAALGTPSRAQLRPIRGLRPLGCTCRTAHSLGILLFWN